VNITAYDLRRAKPRDVKRLARWLGVNRRNGRTNRQFCEDVALALAISNTPRLS